MHSGDNKSLDLWEKLLLVSRQLSSKRQKSSKQNGRLQLFPETDFKMRKRKMCALLIRKHPLHFKSGSLISYWT